MLIGEVASWSLKERFAMPTVHPYILISIICIALVIAVGIHQQWIQTERQINKRIFWLGIGIALASSIFAAVAG